MLDSKHGSKQGSKYASELAVQCKLSMFHEASFKWDRMSTYKCLFWNANDSFVNSIFSTKSVVSLW